MPPQLEQGDLFSGPTSNGSPAPASVAEETRGKVVAVNPETPLKIVSPSDKGMIMLLSLQRLLHRIDTENAKIELAKVGSIALYEDRVRLGIIDLMRKNHGLLSYERANEYQPSEIPSIEEWNAIVKSMPSQLKLSLALPSIAGIKINTVYWAYDRNRFGKDLPGIVAIRITDNGKVEKDESLEKALLKPVGRLSDTDIASRHGIGIEDSAVDYLTKMERFYAIGGTQADAREFMKVRTITITPETISLGGVTLQRKKIGVFNLADATPHLLQTPTKAEWQSIFHAMPGGSEWPKAMKALLDIDLDRNLWEHDINGRGGMVSMETHNIGNRIITCDHNALGKASLFVIAK